MTFNASLRDVPVPTRIKRLPISAKGFPVPWFVATINGAPDFRVIAPSKIDTAVRHELCWVCGDQLGRNFAFTVGSMCSVTRTISEPPSHRECAVFAAVACPFLSNPRARRRAADMPDDAEAPPGMHLDRNPGVVAVWVTRSYKPFQTGDNGVLFEMGYPSEVLWFAHGRVAVRAEVEHAISTGLPALEKLAREESPQALRSLHAQVTDAMRWLPGA